MPEDTTLADLHHERDFGSIEEIWRPKTGLPYHIHRHAMQDGEHVFSAHPNDGSCFVIMIGPKDYAPGINHPTVVLDFVMEALHQTGVPPEDGAKCVVNMDEFIVLRDHPLFFEKGKVLSAHVVPFGKGAV